MSAKKGLLKIVSLVSGISFVDSTPLYRVDLLDAWIAEASPLERGRRVEAAEAIRRYDGFGSLKLRQLSSWPPGLELLDLKNLELEGWETNLQGMPRLSSLTTLCLNKCSHITNFEGMPELPHLKTLILSGYGITSFRGMPSLPVLSSLFFLTFSGLTNLEGFPLLPNLNVLNLNCCRDLSNLNGLPYLPNLHLFDLNDCYSLSSIPASTLTLPSTCSIRLTGTALSLHALRALQAHTQSPGYRGPRFTFSIGPIRYADEDVPFEERLQALYAISEQELKEFRVLSQEGVMRTYLAKLEWVKDFNNPLMRKSVASHVIKFLERGEQDERFRQLFLKVVEEATATCADRIALSLIDLDLLYHTDGGELERPETLFQWLKTARIIDLIQQESIAKVASLAACDPIEVHLGYITHLKEAFRLPIFLEGMHFFQLSAITQNDLERAKTRIEAALQRDPIGMPFLLEDSRWQASLKSTDEWKKFSATFIEPKEAILNENPDGFTDAKIQLCWDLLQKIRVCKMRELTAHYAGENPRLYSAQIQPLIRELNKKLSPSRCSVS